MTPRAEHIHDAAETFGECQRFVHSGRPQVGIQYLMRRWRAIPAALQARFLHDDFLTLPAETHRDIQTLLIVRSREAGIAERTAALWRQTREHRTQQAPLDATGAAVTAACCTRRHHLSEMAALYALIALPISLYHAT